MVIKTLMIVVFAFLIIEFIVCILLASKVAKGVGSLISTSAEIEKTVVKARKLTVKLVKSTEKYTPKGIIKTIGTIIIDTLVIRYFNPFKKA